MDEVTIRLNRPPRYVVRTLGFGERAAIWTQGCSLACPGCASTDTWDADGGSLWSIDALVAELVSRPALDGLTVTGGEPFQQPRALLQLVSSVRQALPVDFDILCYSGYRHERLANRYPEILASIDVLVDGRFQSAVTGRALALRGSTNQRLFRLSELGRNRYPPVVDDVDTARPPLQFVLTEEGFELIGIPGDGELNRLEQLLAERGLNLEDASWRP